MLPVATGVGSISSTSLHHNTTIRTNDHDYEKEHFKTAPKQQLQPHAIHHNTDNKKTSMIITQHDIPAPLIGCAQGNLESYMSCFYDAMGRTHYNKYNNNDNNNNSNIIIIHSKCRNSSNNCRSPSSRNNCASTTATHLRGYSGRPAYRSPTLALRVISERPAVQCGCNGWRARHCNEHEAAFG